MIQSNMWDERDDAVAAAAGDPAERRGQRALAKRTAALPRRVGTVTVAFERQLTPELQADPGSPSPAALTDLSQGHKSD